MTDVLSRLARIEERGLARDEKLNNIEDKVTKLYEAHVSHQGAAKTHRLWAGALGGIAGGILSYIANHINIFPK